MFNRRGFIKRGALCLPAIFLPKFGENPIVVELFNRDGSEVFHLPRASGLQAASTIKQRTFSSIVDNRIKLNNSNFARLWSTDVGTSWTKIRIACRLSIDTSGAANLTSTPRFAFGICSGTSNIFMDATTTHWQGIYSTLATWTYHAGPPDYFQGNTTWTYEKRIVSTNTNGAGGVGDLGGNNWFCYDCATATRIMFAIDITKGSPNFTLLPFTKGTNDSADVTLATYLAQIPLSSMTVTNHTNFGSDTMATDEGANGSFNAVNIAWDRTTGIEISDLAVVKLA